MPEGRGNGAPLRRCGTAQASHNGSNMSERPNRRTQGSSCLAGTKLVSGRIGPTTITVHHKRSKGQLATEKAEIGDRPGKTSPTSNASQLKFIGHC